MYIYGIERLFKIPKLTSSQINFSPTEKSKEQATVLLISGRIGKHNPQYTPPPPIERKPVAQKSHISADLIEEKSRKHATIPLINGLTRRAHQWKN